jgi:replicative DNA helicase
VIDYLQLMSIHGFRGNREQEIAQISHGLKAIAGESKCPLIALSQLNEEGYLRESRAIGHDASVVLVLSEGSYGLSVKIDKGRTIPKGSFDLSIIEQFCRIENA